jgi:hypothetical protein
MEAAVSTSVPQLGCPHRKYRLVPARHLKGQALTIHGDAAWVPGLPDPP